MHVVLYLYMQHCIGRNQLRTMRIVNLIAIALFGLIGSGLTDGLVIDVQYVFILTAAVRW